MTDNKSLVDAFREQRVIQDKGLRLHISVLKGMCMWLMCDIDRYIYFASRWLRSGGTQAPMLELRLLVA